MKNKTMQILVNISEEHYKTLQKMKDVGLGYYNEAILNGKVLPENATNGDMIMAMFPTVDRYFSNVIDMKLWWNAKYRGKK